MKNIRFNVYGMSCHGCENRIKNAISNIKGIKQVEANFETGIVEIVCKDNIGEELIKEKIIDLGFEIR